MSEPTDRHWSDADRELVASHISDRAPDATPPETAGGGQA